MNMKESFKPGLWGGAGGAIVAIVIGFSWGGWLTAGSAGLLAKASASEAVVQEFTPRCVALAEPQTEKLSALKALSTWKHDDYVTEAGWVDHVSEKYQNEVAKVCAPTLIEGMTSS